MEDWEFRGCHQSPALFFSVLSASPLPPALPERAMLQLLSAMRRRLGWPKKRSSRVFDEVALAPTPEEEVAAAVSHRPLGGLALLLAIARAPLAAVSCLACQVEDMEAGAHLHGTEIGDLMVGEAMRFAIYL